MTQPKLISLLLQKLPPHLQERARLLAAGSLDRKGHADRPRKRVLYWTHHALRVDENPALDVAIHLTHQLQLPLLVYQGLSEKYRYASDRHHTFILEAARELQTSYASRGIPFVFHLDRRGSRSPRLAQLALSSAAVVTDDFPLEATKQWTEQLAKSNTTSVVAVDTACVVPMQMVGKAYERAFAYRDATSSLYSSRIDRDWPSVDLSIQAETSLPFESLQLADRSIAELVCECDIDHSIGPVSDTLGGSSAGYSRWTAFRNKGLRSYAKRRNQIEVDGVSRMSAYLHYGMVSPFRIAREASADRAEKFLEELLIWRELAYVFCFYRTDLDSDSNIPDWARETLSKHNEDPRQVLTWETLARGRTGERLWDAAQRSLLKHGELHNNVRMTWGKAILAWSRDHHQALERLIDLNHRYALDGRDPASYGGIFWCLGQFDRPFFPEQPVLGSVRPRPVCIHAERTDLNAYEKRVDRLLADPLPRVAVVGSGLGGLMCSRILQDHGLKVRLFEKSHRAGGRTATRRTRDGFQFDHGAQYFTIRDPNLQRYLDSWIADQHVAEWSGTIVSIDEAAKFHPRERLPRYVGTPLMESLASHLARELDIRWETEVQSVSRSTNGYRVLGADGKELGEFDIVLWNCPPKQIANHFQLSETVDCGWRKRLNLVQMVPCWAVMIALDSKWDVPFDGAFINQGKLSWIARDSSKPSRPSNVETWVLHSTVEWANEHVDAMKEQVVQDLVAEAERVVGKALQPRCFEAAHRWLYSRPVESLQETSLWDSDRWLGACGDWCGGPRVEGALKSGVSLAGRVLGSLHESEAAQNQLRKPQQLSLFGD